MIEKYKLYYRTFLVLFWGAMCWGFVTEEILTPLDKLENAFFLLLDAILLVLGLCLTRTKKDVAVLLSFTAIAVLSTLILNHLSLMNFINGARDFFGLLFTIPILRFFLTGDRAQEFKAKFDKQLKIWMWIQAFCLVWQFIKYGATDHGGGSMGNGASGMVSMLLYLISYYLTVQNWDFNDYLGSLRRNKWNVILLLPTYLNETKISFVLLFLYFLLLYKPTRSSIIKFVYVIPVAIAVCAGVLNIYFKATGFDPEDVLSWEFVEDYFVGTDIDYNIEIALLIQDGHFDDDLDSYWMLDIQRFAKFPLISEPLSETSGGQLFGAGLGQFKGGTMVDETAFMRKYRWILQGSRPWTFTVWVQLGFAGLVWFFWMFITDCFCKVKYNFEIKRMYLFVGACLILTLIYNEAFRYFYFCFGFFYPVFAIRLFHPKDSDDPAQIENYDS